MLPKDIFSEYEKGVNYKASLGSRGMFEQDKINERFYAGDQWHGAKCGADRPLVRHNVIRRIGDFKISSIASDPISVRFTAEGVPETTDIRQKAGALRTAAAEGHTPAADGRAPGQEEIALVMSALNDYFKVTAERLGLDELKHDALKSAYLTGTGILYTYWDPDVKTGLYADEGRTEAIQGDIACELLDVENVYFGDPSRDDVESQPYIILAQRRSVDELRREARRNGRPKADLDAIKPDQVEYMAGDRSDIEQADDKNCTVLTRLWKEWDKEGKTYRVMAMRVVRGAVIRSPWDLQIRRYPIAKFSWDKRKGCIYGDTELTYLIPNQIAINRMVTASVWAVMVMGMPLMVVNNEVVPQPITNDPGQIIRVNGASEDVANAVRYVVPPSFSPNYDNSVNSLIANTMTHAGANDAALGDMRPDNTSAIIALREAASQPLQPYQNAFYAFMEDVARIWAEFWMSLYGRRSLKITDRQGTWYLPFDGERYRELVLSVQVDVGSTTLWSETETIKTLDNLLDRQIITVEQYLTRLPKGIVPDVAGIIEELPDPAEQAGLPVAAGDAGSDMPTGRPANTDGPAPGLDAAPAAMPTDPAAMEGNDPLAGISPQLLAQLLAGGAGSDMPTGGPVNTDGPAPGLDTAPAAMPADPAAPMRPDAVPDHVTNPAATGRATDADLQPLLTAILCQLPDQDLRTVVETALETDELAASAWLLTHLPAQHTDRLLAAAGDAAALAASLADLLERLLDHAQSPLPVEAADTPAEAAAIAAIREQLPAPYQPPADLPPEDADIWADVQPHPAASHGETHKGRKAKKADGKLNKKDKEGESRHDR